MCNRQIGSSSPGFGVKIPKIFELPPPTKTNPSHKPKAQPRHPPTSRPSVALAPLIRSGTCDWRWNRKAREPNKTTVLSPELIFIGLLKFTKTNGFYTWKGTTITNDIFLVFKGCITPYKWLKINRVTEDISWSPFLPRFLGPPWRSIEEKSQNQRPPIKIRKDKEACWCINHKRHPKKRCQVI